MNELYKIVGYFNGNVLVFENPIFANFLNTGDIVDLGAAGVARVVFNVRAQPEYIYLNGLWSGAVEAKEARKAVSK